MHAAAHRQHKGYPMILFSAASTAGTSSRLRRLGFRAVAGVEPAVTFQAESGGRDHLLYNCTALRAFAGRRVGKLLAQLKLVKAACATVFVHRHDVLTPLNVFKYLVHYSDAESRLSMMRLTLSV
jgi:hypothetical protein